jgi:hypothetical protein
MHDRSPWTAAPTVIVEPVVVPAPAAFEAVIVWTVDLSDEPP